MISQETLDIIKSKMQSSNNIVLITGSGIVPFNFETMKYYRDIPIQWVFSPYGILYYPNDFADLLRDHFDFRCVEPTQVHRLITTLAQKFNTTVLTNNMDNLHEKANLTPIHCLGSVEGRMICNLCGQVYGTNERLYSFPECDCGYILQPDVVLFGQQIPEDRWNLMQSKIKESDLIISIGASLNQLPLNQLLVNVEKDKFIIINQTATPLDSLANIVINDDDIISILQYLTK